jgi:hypothetical protein
MKTKLMTLLIVALGFVAINASAQEADASRVKILVANQPGVLRLIHAIKVDKPVNVRFSNSDGILLSDEIAGTFPRGVSKKYDVSKLGSRDFQVEISTSEITVTYQIVVSKDKKTMTPRLVKTVHNYAYASLN